MVLVMNAITGLVSCQYTSRYEGIDLTMSCEINTSIDAVFVWATGSQEIGLQILQTTTGHLRKSAMYNMMLSPSSQKSAFDMHNYFWCQTVVKDKTSLKVVSTTPFTLQAMTGIETRPHCQLHEHTLLALNNGVSSEISRQHKSMGHLLALRQEDYQEQSDNNTDMCSKQITSTIAVASIAATIVLIVIGCVALMLVVIIVRRYKKSM